jgi:hypothetical protein
MRRAHTPTKGNDNARPMVRRPCEFPRDFRGTAARGARRLRHASNLGAGARGAALRAPPFEGTEIRPGGSVPQAAGRGTFRS